MRPRTSRRCGQRPPSWPRAPSRRCRGRRAAANLRPVLGVDLAVRNEGPLHSGKRGVNVPRSNKRKPARGGAFADAHDSGLPRVVLLAQNKQGWAAICRLVSATHLAGERGKPVTSHDLIRQHASDEVVLLLGPDSDVGRALAQRRPDLATQALNRWRETSADPATDI